MASAPIVGGGGSGNDGSREKHRWADASKVYTRKSFNKGSKSSSNLNSQPPPRSKQTLSPPAAGDSSLHQQPHSSPPPATASDDDSSSLNRRANPNQSKNNPANGQRRVVTISLACRSKHEVRDLRAKLTTELDQVRALYRKLGSRENHQAPAFGATTATPPQFFASDAALRTPVSAKRGPPPLAAANSEAGSNGPLRRQLSVSVPENSLGEKEKRTPKANQYYRNSDFVLGKERFPPADSHSHKKSKSNGSKMAGVYNKLYSQAFKSCSSLLSKLMKHKHGWVFNTPVDVNGLGLRDYYTIIRHPMDLGTVNSRLSKNRYKTPEEFAEDVRLTFRNAMTYNPKGQDVHVMAELLLQMFEERWPATQAEYTYVLSPRPSPSSVKRPPPIDMKKVLEMSDSMVQPMSVDSKAKPVSYTPHVGRPPAPKKPKAKDPHKRDMTFEEKQKLSNQLQNLPPEKMDNIVQIIKKRNSTLSQHDDEIEVDIDSVDTETLWELDRFVTNYKKSLSKTKKKVELAELALHAREDSHHKATQESAQESNPDPEVAEAPKESKTETMVLEKVMASPPPRGAEKKADNASRSSSSGSSSSGSESSSSDSDTGTSSAASDAGQ